MPVIDYYRKQGKVVEVSGRSIFQIVQLLQLNLCPAFKLDASKSIPEVYVDVKKAVDEQFAKGA